MGLTFYNNKIAGLLQFITGFTSISIGPFILVSEDSATQARLRHLETHTRQWIEITLASAILVLLFDGLSISGLITSLFIYYIWWGIEYLVRLIISKATIEVGDVAFEQEAEYASDNDDYSTSKLFGWIKYLND